MNDLLADLDLPRWANEGTACLFGFSNFRDGEHFLHEIESDSYPVWYLKRYPLTGDIGKDKESKVFFPLDDLIHDREVIDLDENVNDYYLHWFVTAHYFFFAEEGKHRSNFLKFLRAGCPTENFGEVFGPIGTVEKQVYEHFLTLTQS
jgi:hypothetical protein